MATTHLRHNLGRARPRFIRAVALVGAAALALLTGANSALAADPDPALPDPARNGTATLTITKLAGEVAKSKATGGQVAGVTGKPGYEFELYKIDPKVGPALNLLVKEDWAKITGVQTLLGDALNAVFIPSMPNNWKATFIADGETTGSPSASLTFSNLAYGLYLAVPANETLGDISRPFLVTVPLTDQKDLNNWLYDVFVYPKDEVITLQKAVDTSAVRTLGDKAHYTTTAGVPKDRPSAYRIDDVAWWYNSHGPEQPPQGQGTITIDDPITVTLVGGNPVAPLQQCLGAPTVVPGVHLELHAGPNLGNVVPQPTAPYTQDELSNWGLLPTDNWAAATPANCDFYISYVYNHAAWAGLNAAGHNYEREESQQYFRIDFSPSGLDKLGNAGPNAKVIVDYYGTVQTSDQPSLVGEADLYANTTLLAASLGELKEIDVTSAFARARSSAEFQTGQYLIYKTNNKGEPLDGAQFAIYALGANPDCATAVRTGNPIEMWFTGPGGFPVEYGFGGVDNTVTQGPVADVSLDSGLNGYGKGYTMTGELLYGDYCAVEVKAPAGYSLALAPFAFTTSRLNSMGPWNEMCMANIDEHSPDYTITGCKRLGENGTIPASTPDVTNPDWPTGYYAVPVAMPTVVDLPFNAGFELPLTGWTGLQTTFAATGLVFLALAGAYVVKQRRNTVSAH